MFFDDNNNTLMLAEVALAEVRRGAFSVAELCTSVFSVHLDFWKCKLSHCNLIECDELGRGQRQRA